MSEFNLIDMGKLSEPATELIKRVSDALGGAFRPWQIKRVAVAEGEAERIRAFARVDITEIEQRAMRRLLLEEGKKQENIENITSRALPLIADSAKPGDMEDDWVTNFFDKCRSVSTEEMQVIWANILAGEANVPGSFSKRTVNLLASLDRRDALLFSKLCGFVWTVLDPTPLIFDPTAEIYSKYGLGFSAMKHLDSIGLVSFESLVGYVRKGFGKKARMLYQDRPLFVKFPKDNDNNLQIGKILFTAAGAELAAVCTPEHVDGLFEYVKQEWAKEGCEVSETLN